MVALVSWIISFSRLKMTQWTPVKVQLPAGVPSGYRTNFHADIPGEYSAFFTFNGSDLPEAVRTNFLNWKNAPEITCNLNLEIKSEYTSFLTNVVSLRPSIQSGEQFLFAIADFNISKSGEASVSLTNNGHLVFFNGADAGFEIHAPELARKNAIAMAAFGQVFTVLMVMVGCLAFWIKNKNLNRTSQP